MKMDIGFAVGIVEILTQPVTIIANLLTIIAFVMVPGLQTQSSNLLIFALSIIDCVSGIYQLLFFGIPLTFGFYPLFDEIGCMMTMPFEYTYSVGNIILVAISIDRVLLVSMDYSKYVKTMTKFRLKVTIAICFLICYTASAFELSLWNYAKRNNVNAASVNFKERCLFPVRRLKWFGIYVSGCFFFLPLILVAIFSVVFVKRLMKRLGKDVRVGPAALQNTENHARSGNDDQHGIAADPSALATDDANHNTAKKRYMKSAVTLAALVSAMCISMLPYCSYVIVVATLSGTYSPIVTNILYMVLQLNPLLDPIFFAATQKGIREFYGHKIRAMFRTLFNPN